MKEFMEERNDEKGRRCYFMKIKKMDEICLEFDAGERNKNNPHEIWKDFIFNIICRMNIMLECQYNTLQLI